jgi:non-specific serine/threonine protein kinase/serine/threonine-protein kinase
LSGPDRPTGIFLAACALPPEARPAFLDASCAGDAALRSEIEAMLAADERAGGGRGTEGLVAVVGRVAASAADSTVTAMPGAISGSPSEPIGPYSLLRRIGEGGMGEVWLAEQSKPVRRKVALKLIKAGMDSRQVIARFEAERQALALMGHSAIAKVYEAGVTRSGLPYFAMEYVAGEPINAYCDRQRLDMPERLELFALVCDGVQHAHQKGVIHRDLKPSNILVTIQDGRPVPKIIDFGVAKAIAQRLTEKTMFTELGVLLGTPEYMSPEQAELTGLDVDTRTDVYALGVILYELLTGALPFESSELRQAGFDEIRRRIREVDPPRPSTRVRTMGEASTGSARNRRTEPGRLASQIKGDLDWITMKALEKDRTRRYGSPSELAADLGRHIRHEPVLAGPPNALYRARKFVRRHRLGVSIASAAVIGMVAFSIVTAAQARRIARSLDRAERVSSFLTDLFEVSDPGTARGNTITAREVLDRGAERIDKELGDEPEVQAQLMETMGWVYYNLGLYENATPIVERAVEIRRRILGADHPDTLDAIELQACLYEREGRYADAERVGRQNVDDLRRVLGEEHPATLHSMEHLSVVYEREGRYDESLRLSIKVLEADRRVLPENHGRTLWAMQNVAADYMWLGRYDEAEALFRQAFEIRQREFGPDHPDTLWTKSNLGKLAIRRGMYDEAEAIVRETLEARRRVLGPDHQDTLTSTIDLGWACEHQHRYAEAEALYRQAYETLRRVLGEEHASTLQAKQAMAGAIAGQGRLEEARKLLLEALEAMRRVLGEENSRTVATTSRLATVLDQQKHHEEAEKLLRRVLDADRRIFGPNHPDTLDAISKLGGACSHQKRYDEAEKLYSEALEGQRRVLGPRHPDTLDDEVALAGVVGMRGGRAQALELIGHAVEAGYRDADYLSGEPTLQPLHGDVQFERLVAVARDNAQKKREQAR